MPPLPPSPNHTHRPTTHTAARRHGQVHVAPDGLFAPATITGAISSNGAAPTDGLVAASASLSARTTLRNGGATAAMATVQYVENALSTLATSAVCECACGL